MAKKKPLKDRLNADHNKSVLELERRLKRQEEINTHLESVVDESRACLQESQNHLRNGNEDLASTLLDAATRILSGPSALMQTSI